MTLKIVEPVFHSRQDEDAFFGWLKGIPAITEVEGVGDGLRVEVDVARLETQALHDLIALHKRYGIPMSSLAALETSDNSRWFRDPDAYWFGEIFGK